VVSQIPGWPLFARSLQESLLASWLWIYNFKIVTSALSDGRLQKQLGEFLKGGMLYKNVCAVENGLSLSKVGC